MRNALCYQILLWQQRNMDVNNLPGVAAQNHGGRQVVFSNGLLEPWCHDGVSILNVLFNTAQQVMELVLVLGPSRLVLVLEG